MDRTAAHVADMAAFTRELRELARPYSLQEFLANRVLCLPVEKLFINLGEAARRIDPAQAEQIPGVDWRRLIRLRKILAHGYEQVAHEVLFKSVGQDLPPLQAALDAWLANCDRA